MNLKSQSEALAAALSLVVACVGHAQNARPAKPVLVASKFRRSRVEEVLAVEKPDIHFEKLSMQIVRAVVHGRVKLVKTEYSEDELPLDPDLAAILLDFIREAEREALAKLGDEGWDHRIGTALCQPDDGTAFPRVANRTGLHMSCRLLSRGLLELWGSSRRVVQDRLSRPEREAPAIAR
jgi:hypothetical protein